MVNSLAQVILKKGVGLLNLRQSPIPLFVSTVTNIYILGGVSLFVLALFLWLYLLSQYDLSFLYPITSLGFVITAFSGWLFLSETISVSRAIGILLILVGVVFVAKS
ncbi:hypothetical protein FACS189449_08310 [Alphaproteobacteria bacterium]|nr:hypothetical protein FACS189449_08310 [Alphaproteobacteria bacterium]